MSKISSIVHLYSILDDQLSLNQHHFVIAIDGDAASGKTTLSTLLANRYHGTLIHTDQFYLPFDKRNDYPAGHMNIKKIIHEVLIPHALRKETHYEWYDPHLNKIREIIQKPFTPLLILEGSYALHPDILPYLDYKIMMSISTELQEKRILSRSNPEVLEKFKTMWIPKEKAYQHFYNIQSTADIIIDADASSI